MTDETEANQPADDEVTLVEATPEPETGAEAEDAEDETEELAKLAGVEAEDGEPGPVEIEYEGKTYKVDPEIKDAILRHSDYTRKTMDVAEQRKAVEAEKARIEELSTISEEARVSLVNAAALTMRLRQLEETSIDGLSRDQVNGLRLDHQDLTRQISEWERRGHEATEKDRTARSQLTAKARETAATEASKHIKNFDARRPQIAAYLTSYGEDPEAIFGTIDNPLIWRILEDADIGRRFKETQRKSAHAKTAGQVQPVEQVGGKKSGAVRDPDKLSPEEWVKWRERQLAKS